MTRGVLVRRFGSLALLGALALAVASCSSRKCDSYMYSWSRNVSAHAHDSCVVVIENEYARAEYGFPSLDDAPGCRNAWAGCPRMGLPDPAYPYADRCTYQVGPESGCSRYWKTSDDELFLNVVFVDQFRAYFHDAPFQVSLSCGGATIVDHEPASVSCVVGA